MILKIPYKTIEDTLRMPRASIKKRKEEKGPRDALGMPGASRKKWNPKTYQTTTGEVVELTIVVPAYNPLNFYLNPDGTVRCDQPMLENLLRLAEQNKAKSFVCSRVVGLPNRVEYFIHLLRKYKHS